MEASKSKIELIARLETELVEKPKTEVSKQKDQNSVENKMESNLSKQEDKTKDVTIFIDDPIPKVAPKRNRNFIFKDQFSPQDKSLSESENDEDYEDESDEELDHSSSLFSEDSDPNASESGSKYDEKSNSDLHSVPEKEFSKEDNNNNSTFNDEKSEAKDSKATGLVFKSDDGKTIVLKFYNSKIRNLTIKK